MSVYEYLADTLKDQDQQATSSNKIKGAGKRKYDSKKDAGENEADSVLAPVLKGADYPHESMYESVAPDKENSPSQSMRGLLPPRTSADVLWNSAFSSEALSPVNISSFNTSSETSLEHTSLPNHALFDPFYYGQKFNDFTDGFALMTKDSTPPADDTKNIEKAIRAYEHLTSVCTRGQEFSAALIEFAEGKKQKHWTDTTIDRNNMKNNNNDRLTGSSGGRESVEMFTEPMSLFTNLVSATTHGTAKVDESNAFTLDDDRFDTPSSEIRRHGYRSRSSSSVSNKDWIASHQLNSRSSNPNERPDIHVNPTVAAKERFGILDKKRGEDEYHATSLKSVTKHSTNMQKIDTEILNSSVKVVPIMTNSGRKKDVDSQKVKSAKRRLSGNKSAHSKSKNNINSLYLKGSLALAGEAKRIAALIYYEFPTHYDVFDRLDASFVRRNIILGDDAAFDENSMESLERLPSLIKHLCKSELRYMTDSLVFDVVAEGQFNKKAKGLSPCKVFHSPATDFLESLCSILNLIAHALELSRKLDTYGDFIKRDIEVTPHENQALFLNGSTKMWKETFCDLKKSVSGIQNTAALYQNDTDKLHVSASSLLQKKRSPRKGEESFFLSDIPLSSSEEVSSNERTPEKPEDIEKDLTE